MVRIKKYPTICISAQLEVLHKYFPSGKTISHNPSKFEWVLGITPTPNSITYKVKIEYTLGQNPNIFVISPKRLKKYADTSSLQHVYDEEEQQICLFRPGIGEWQPYKFIAKTIVPWAAEWLAFYEIWVLTGEWKGEGLHPRKYPSKRKTINRK